MPPLFDWEKQQMPLSKLQAERWKRDKERRWHKQLSEATYHAAAAHGALATSDITPEAVPELAEVLIHLAAARDLLRNAQRRQVDWGTGA